MSSAYAAHAFSPVTAGPQLAAGVTSLPQISSDVWNAAGFAVAPGSSPQNIFTDLSSVRLASVSEIDGIDFGDTNLTQRLPQRSAPLPPLHSQSAPVVPNPVKPHTEHSLAQKLGLSAEAARAYSLVLFTPQNVPSAERVRQFVDAEKTGLAVVEANRVNFRVSTTHVRYYDRRDQGIAQAVAASLGGPARDFSRTPNSAPPGRIEIWFQGDRAGRSTASSEPTASPPAPASKTQLEQRLVNKLRLGQHLSNGGQ